MGMRKFFDTINLKKSQRIVRAKRTKSKLGVEQEHDSLQSLSLRQRITTPFARVEIWTPI
jgi:hypothetical protein